MDLYIPVTVTATSPGCTCRMFIHLVLAHSPVVGMQKESSCGGVGPSDLCVMSHSLGFMFLTEQVLPTGTCLEGSPGKGVAHLRSLKESAAKFLPGRQT